MNERVVLPTGARIKLTKINGEVAYLGDASAYAADGDWLVVPQRPMAPPPGGRLVHVHVEEAASNLSEQDVAGAAIPHIEEETALARVDAAPIYVVPKRPSPPLSGGRLAPISLDVVAANLTDEDREDVRAHTGGIVWAMPNMEAAQRAAVATAGYVGAQGALVPPAYPVEPVLLAVYGTGRRGGEHHWRLGNAAYLGSTSIPGLALRDLEHGPDQPSPTEPGPAAVPTDGVLAVEVYEPSADAVRWLDAYEGPAFVREPWTTPDGRKVGVYVFRAEREGPRRG